MEERCAAGSPPPHPHVVIIPVPAQGHMKPMLTLAQLLSQADFSISFVTTDYCHSRMLDLINGADFRRCFPRIEFLSIPDGLPPDHPRSGPSIFDMFYSVETVGKPILRDMITAMTHAPSCIISDVLMSFTNDVAAELGIPVITRVDSAARIWIDVHSEKLIQDGEIPFQLQDMDKLISCIPGLETILRRQDLPTNCRLDPKGRASQLFIKRILQAKKTSSALILNTFQELESPIIFSHLHSVFHAVYPIGPLHYALRSTTSYSTPYPSLISSTGKLQFDQSCLKWLDSQRPNSVLYVCFGTVAYISPHQLMEIWHGLVNSEKPFLWAIRPDLIWDVQNGSEELKKGTIERGRTVDWAPQEDVLCHNAVVGFFTLAGWNSCMESICAGKPMICWPIVSDQPLNARLVSAAWKIGLDMEATCDRSMVEKMVKMLMEGSTHEEIVESAAEIARLAQNTIRDGGSSRANMNKLIRDIKLLHSNKVGLKTDN